jgi:serine/threonine protein kinase
MAPEVADRERYSNEKSDIWSFGMTLIELIDLDVPGNDRFCDANLQDQEEVIQIIAHSRHVPSFKRPNFSHVLHIMLMKYILCLNPEQRRTSSQLENVNIYL